LKEILNKKERFESKKLLRLIYEKFNRMVARKCDLSLPGLTVELGSGFGMMKQVLPECLVTDIQLNPWIDRVENAYRLSFPDSSVANLILFDVFHHLRYPGAALQEFSRVLVKRGRVIIFDPWMGITGRIVYSLFHQEPVGWRQPISWFPDNQEQLESPAYYSAQGNTTRIFSQNSPFHPLLAPYRIISLEKFASLSYLASGGFKWFSLYPETLLPLVERIDKELDRFPGLFASRALIVLEREER